MGCGASSNAAPGPPPPSGQPPVPLECRELVTTTDFSVSGGMFSGKEMKSTQREEGALYSHVMDAANAGLELVSSIPKMEVPQQTMQMGSGGMMGALKGNMSGSAKQTLLTFFRPVPAGEAVATVLVHAPLNVDTSIGFLNAKVTVQDGVTGTIQQYAQQGYRLAGISLASSAAHAQMTGSVSSSLAELVFQKRAAAGAMDGVEVSFTQTAMKARQSFAEHLIATKTLRCTATAWMLIVAQCSAIPRQVTAGMSGTQTTLPDWGPFLFQKGAEGYELEGLFTPPSQMQNSGMGMKMEFDLPVQMLMTKRPGAAPRKFHIDRFRYIMKVSGLGPAGIKIEGDVAARAKEFAAAGWTLKGALNLPMERSGMNMRMPVLCFYEAPNTVTEFTGEPAEVEEAVDDDADDGDKEDDIREGDAYSEEADDDDDDNDDDD